MTLIRRRILLRLPSLQTTKDISDYLVAFCVKLKEHYVLARFLLPYRKLFSQ